MDQYEIVVANYNAKLKSGEKPDFKELLNALSNEAVKVTFRKENENTKGSFCFKDKKTGYEIRLVGGARENETYLRDGKGEEVLFFQNLDPKYRQGLDPRFDWSSYSIRNCLKRIGGDTVMYIGNESAQVTYQTYNDPNRRNIALLREYRRLTSNAVSKLLNMKKIKKLKSSLSENQPSYGEENFDRSSEWIESEETVKLFKIFFKIIGEASGSMKRFNISQKV